MKKTAFDKIVVGFVILVVLIFAFLMISNISTSQNSVLAERQSTMKKEITLLADGSITEYSNGDIDSQTLYSDLQHAADTLDMEIWLTDSKSNIVFRSDESSGSKINSKADSLKNYVDKEDLTSAFCYKNTLNGYYSSETLTVGQPLYYWNNYMGTIILTSPMTFKHDIMSRMLSTTFVPFLILMLIAMIALMLMSNSLLKPIREIIKTSKSYAQGNFNARVNVTANNEFGELARYMEEMADELSRSNEYRKSFISNISHDFRSPLTSIKGYIEAMLDGTIPLERHEKYLGIVLNEAQRLTKLTQGLLELNNFDSFDLQLDKSNFDIRDIITPTVNTFEKRCQDRGIFLDSVFLTDNTIVYADRTKIQQVIYNLVDNAIKFTPEGRQIRVQVTEKDNKIFTSVKDEGVGIPKDAQKKVFERFYKTDPSRGKDKTGTGLGLAITKEIIKAHGEQITLTSEEGEGSEFVFSLPKEKDMQVPIKPVHVQHTKHQPETKMSSSDVKKNGKFRIKDS